MADVQRDKRGRFVQGNKEGQKISGGEAAEMGRKGGLKSVESHRNRARLITALEILLERQYKNKQGEVRTGFEIAAIGLFNRLKAGDTNAFKLAAEMLGEYRKGLDVSMDGLHVNVSVEDEETAKMLNNLLGDDADD